MATGTVIIHHPHHGAAACTCTCTCTCTCDSGSAGSHFTGAGRCTGPGKCRDRLSTSGSGAAGCSPAVCGECDGPLSPEAIKQLRSGLDGVQRSSGTAPVTAAPRIRSLTVKLEPGSSLPMVQVLPNFPGVVNFTDQTGAPWPIAAPPVNGNPAGFQVNYLPDTPSMSIQARRAYDTGSVTVYLKGLAVPVVVSMTSGEPGNPDASQPTDSRVDLRIPQRGPAALPASAPRQKVGLYDNTLQAFLDGVPRKKHSASKHRAVFRMSRPGSLAMTFICVPALTYAMRSTAHSRLLTVHTSGKCR